MRIFGLTPLDAGIILLYLAVVLWLGRRSQRRTRDSGDFYADMAALGWGK